MEQVKQTAVEWLHEIAKQREPDKFDWQQAKEMEKEQIIDTHKHGFKEGTCFGATTIYKFISAEQYFNETYGK